MSDLNMEKIESSNYGGYLSKYKIFGYAKIYQRDI